MPRSRQEQRDPTRQAGNRAAATKALQRRLRSAKRQVDALFEAVPRSSRREQVTTNATIPVYDYQISPAELELLEQNLRDVLADEVLETRATRLPPNWWWQDYIEKPYRQGAVREVAEFNQLIARELVRVRSVLGGTTQRLEVGAVLTSQEYRDALQKAYVRNFNSLKTLSDRTADQVVQVLNAGLAARKPPADIAADIAQRFDVSRTSAERTAHTEVNQAYNDARLDATEIAARQTGYRAGVLHLSALMLTTRDSHGARHGSAYTVAQQRQWWNTGANRIRCHCSTRSVLLDADGKVIDLELQEEIQAERGIVD